MSNTAHIIKTFFDCPHHPVLSTEEGGVGWELEKESLKEGLVQPQLGGRLTLDDGSQLHVVPDQHHLLGLVGHNGNHALGLRAHGALVYDQLHEQQVTLNLRTRLWRSTRKHYYKIYPSCVLYGHSQALQSNLHLK